MRKDKHDFAYGIVGNSGDRHHWNKLCQMAHHSYHHWLEKQKPDFKDGEIQ